MPISRFVVGLIALAASIVSMWVSPGPVGVLGAGLALLMLAIVVIDARRFIIPDPLTAAGFLLGLVNAGLSDPEAWAMAVAMAALRGLVLALLFVLLREGYRRWRGREGIGLGDVKLAGVAGAWLDWSIMPIAVDIAALSALAAYLVRQYAMNRPLRRGSLIPFGVFLAPAIWIGWLLALTLFASG